MLPPVSQATGISAVLTPRRLRDASDFASILRFRVFIVAPVGAIYKLHRGERSNDLKRPPIASCLQCQASALAFGGFCPALFFDSWLLACRGEATDMAVALASRQCPLAVLLMGLGLADGLMVSGLANGPSAGIAFVSGAAVSVFAGVLNSLSLSPFADSFAATAGSILL
jgi:hypothetical protein